MYTMMEACRETGLTYQTLKFYCNEGISDIVPGRPFEYRSATENFGAEADGFTGRDE